MDHLVSRITTLQWDSWKKLTLTSQKHNLKFILNTKNQESIVHSSIDSSFKLISETKSVFCEIVPAFDEILPDRSKNWLTKLCNIIEQTLLLNDEIIPEIFHYIDLHIHRDIRSQDESNLSLLADRSTILIPDKNKMSMIAKYGKSMLLIGLDPKYLSSIAEKMLTLDQFSMKDIHSIFKNVTEKSSPLKARIPVLAIQYIFSLDGFQSEELPKFDFTKQFTNEINEDISGNITLEHIIDTDNTEQLESDDVIMDTQYQYEIWHEKTKETILSILWKSSLGIPLNLKRIIELGNLSINRLLEVEEILIEILLENSGLGEYHDINQIFVRAKIDVDIQKKMDQSISNICPECSNSISTLNVGQCNECDNDIFICSICKKGFTSNDKASNCPFCHSPFHYNQLYESVKLFGECPICKNPITLDTIKYREI